VSNSAGDNLERSPISGTNSSARLMSCAPMVSTLYFLSAHEDARRRPDAFLKCWRTRETRVKCELRPGSPRRPEHARIATQLLGRRPGYDDARPASDGLVAGGHLAERNRARLACPALRRRTAFFCCGERGLSYQEIAELRRCPVAPSNPNARRFAKARLCSRTSE